MSMTGITETLTTESSISRAFFPSIDAVLAVFVIPTI